MGTIVLTNGKQWNILRERCTVEESIEWCATIEPDPRKPGWDVAWIPENVPFALENVECWPMWYPHAREDDTDPLEFPDARIPQD